MERERKRETQGQRTKKIGERKEERKRERATETET